MDKHKCIKFGIVVLMAGMAATCMAILGCSRAVKSDGTAMRYVARPDVGDSRTARLISKKRPNIGARRNVMPSSASDRPLQR